MNVYQYFIVFLIIPLLSGTINAFANVHVTWKLNTLIYDCKERKIEIYKQFYLINNIVRISLMLLSIGVIFQSESLFIMNIHQLFSMIGSYITGGAIIGYILGKQNWKSFNER